MYWFSQVKHSVCMPGVFIVHAHLGRRMRTDLQIAGNPLCYSPIGVLQSDWTARSFLVARGAALDRPLARCEGAQSHAAVVIDWASIKSIWTSLMFFGHFLTTYWEPGSPEHSRIVHKVVVMSRLGSPCCLMGHVFFLQAQTKHSWSMRKKCVLIEVSWFCPHLAVSTQNTSCTQFRCFIINQPLALSKKRSNIERQATLLAQHLQIV